MDAATRLIERNGTPAEKFCHYARLQDTKSAEEVLGSLLPGDTIELPLLFNVAHEVCLYSSSTIYPPGRFEWDGSELKELAIELEKRNIDFNNLGTIYQAYWWINFESNPPFKTSHIVKISSHLLNELTNSCHESIRKLATFFLSYRAAEEKKKEEKEKERQKQIAANARGLTRRDKENNCWASFNVNRNALWDEAWNLYQEAIKCSNRKDFAAAIKHNPFRSILFFCHDHYVRSRSDFDRAYAQLSHNELTRIAVEIYGKDK